MGREIGKIIEVRGVSVKAELYELLPPYIVKSAKTYLSPRINSFVKTRVGLDTIICQITGEYFDEQKKGNFTGYYIELAVKGYIDNKHFIQGIRMLPMVSACIELLEEKDFLRINECLDGNAFSLGTNLFDYNQKCFFDYNTIIPSHIGIFGNTGSGKSNTLAKLLNVYSQKLKNTNKGKVLIIDINNEYGGDAICESELKAVYTLTTRKVSSIRVPFDFYKLQEDEWCILLNATEATQKPVIKTACRDLRNKEDYCELIRRMLKTGQREFVRSLQYHMAAFIRGIESFKWHAKSECFYYEDDECIYSNQEAFNKKLQEIEIDIPDDLLKKFLFKLYFAVATHIGFGTQFEYLSPLLRRAEKLFSDFDKIFTSSNKDIFEDKNIAVLQLADVNKDMLELIPSIILNDLFCHQIDEKRNGKIKSIINVVVDEAHNLLYEEELNAKHTNITIEVFERAIKEGRKFGLFLWISSQRPSDISSTIVSQMHNYFIHKLVNPNDLSKIRKAVAFLDQNMMDSLTVLGPGECIVSGTGVNMPFFIKIDRLSDKLRPNSENVVLIGDEGIFEQA